MVVSSYQIHNVLNVYSKQLSQDRVAGKHKSGNKKALSDQINLSAEGKRRATIEKVAKDILNKISHYGFKNEIKDNLQHRPYADLKTHLGSDEQQETTFVFNVIDELNEKTTNSLSVEDTNFLINRLEQLAEDAVS
jgi:hypothetical protein